MSGTYKFTLNGQPEEITGPPMARLLDVLREGRVQKISVKSVARDSYFRAKPTL